MSLSVVIPVYNESESLEDLYIELTTVLKKLKKSYEIIFVDDGSDDNSLEILENLHNKDKRVQVISLRRNFGQSAAFSAGFDYASGEIIVTLDADLQNDPSDIPKLLGKIEEGYEMVVGWREDRKDDLLTRIIPSKVANKLICLVVGTNLHDHGCSLKAFRSEVVKNIKLYGEMHRFIPALASWIGVKICEVSVNHEPRKAGKSKYGLMRTFKVALDLITVKFLIDYANRPIHIFGFLGAACLLAGTAIGAYLSILKLFFDQPLSDRPMLFLVILLIIFGFQLITLGLLGEMLMRTYYESQNKPIYMIKKFLGKQTDKVNKDKL
jgi:glycosyltransferase involved in cell wall biosynthesis